MESLYALSECICDGDFLFTDKPVLEVEVRNAVCRYTYLEKTSNINVVINGGKMYANRLKEGIMKKSLIFSTVESASELSDICGKSQIFTLHFIKLIFYCNYYYKFLLW